MFYDVLMEKKAKHYHWQPASDFDKARAVPRAAIKDPRKAARELKKALIKNRVGREKVAFDLRLPTTNKKTKADDMREYFREREHLSDEDVIEEYAKRNQRIGRIGGALLGAGLGSGLIQTGIGLGVREMGTNAGSGEVKTKVKGGGKTLKGRVVRGLLGAGVGTYLGGRYGRDHAYHVSDAALPLLRREMEKKRKKRS